MEPRKQQQKTAIVLAKISPQQLQNPLENLQTRFKELESGFKLWLSKQSLPVEASIVTATSAVQGAAIGVFMGTLTNDASSSIFPTPPDASLNPQASASLNQAQVFFFSSLQGIQALFSLCSVSWPR